MASSSVSQESLDINDDYERNARRTRIRTLRARGALHRVGDRDSETSGDVWDMNGDDESTPAGSTGISSKLINHDPRDNKKLHCLMLKDSF